MFHTFISLFWGVLGLVGPHQVNKLSKIQHLFFSNQHYVGWWLCINRCWHIYKRWCRSWSSRLIFVGTALICKNPSRLLISIIEYTLSSLGHFSRNINCGLFLDYPPAAYMKLSISPGTCVNVPNNFLSLRQKWSIPFFSVKHFVWPCCSIFKGIIHGCWRTYQNRTLTLK